MNSSAGGNFWPNLSGVAQVVERVATHNVLAPTHWQSFIELFFLVPGAIWTHGIPQAVFVALICAVVGKSVFLNLWFAIKDPDRLQREEHLIEKRRIDLLLDDRHRPGSIATIDATPTANTHIASEGGRDG
ncbi:hypothetical protein [Mesorhizobium huakuii]|uniref:Uncharacterized protein n=1 Tax=Mesorhizobium huakuii TaxID=28104 RepID=A0A7G6SUN5_9HYPH|nr:hypothetical protein [Mesorhizobium huakuii]QND58217.1 hypothetical protein HB778_17680 [Mesorhizobium huakuii]